ncbi:hypothetical protein FOZ63_029104 [Perkinsus olseni]|uniref:Uncharacterized protein n=1 Tax=Perkinsus olseni TaxID=32597 RepID=A0A7J6TY35_PEROL|nr:hypothetical protein FOZ63_029104 [Perkinsus olseni]
MHNPDSRRKPSKELSDEAGASIVDLAHGAFVTPLGADGTGRRQEAVRATSVNVFEYGSTDTPNKASQRKHVMRAYTTRAEPHMQLRGPLTRLARKHLNKDGATKEAGSDTKDPDAGKSPPKACCSYCTAMKLRSADDANSWKNPVNAHLVPEWYRQRRAGSKAPLAAGTYGTISVVGKTTVRLSVRDVKSIPHIFSLSVEVADGLNECLANCTILIGMKTVREMGGRLDVVKDAFTVACSMLTGP